MPKLANPYHDAAGNFTDAQHAKLFSLRGEVKKAGWNPKDKQVSFGKIMSVPCGRAARGKGGSYVMCTTGSRPAKKDAQVEQRGTDIKGIFLTEALELEWEVDGAEAVAEAEAGYSLYVGVVDGEVVWAILDEEEEVVELGQAVDLEEGQQKAEVARSALVAQVGLVEDPEEQYESLADLLNPLLQ
jgi:hypothetical protein